MTELFVIDRADKKFVAEHSAELNKPALYILVNRDKRKLYVGETDDSIKRLKNHEAKDFWTEAIVFHSTTETLSTTEVRWLEAKTYEALKELGYYDLSENKVAPQQPPLKKNQIYTLEPIFEEAKNYICAAGFDIFLKGKEEQKVEVKPVATSEHIFYCKHKESKAMGYLIEATNEFVLLAGSELRSGTRPSLQHSLVDKRAQFIAKQCDTINGISVLRANYVASSPSIAGAFILGRNTNGWTKWKDADGKTLDEVYRKK